MVTLSEIEKNYIIQAMEMYKGNKSVVAKVLGISVKTLYNKLHFYNLTDKYITKKVVNEMVG